MSSASQDITSYKISVSPAPQIVLSANYLINVSNAIQATFFPKAIPTQFMAAAFPALLIAKPVLMKKVNATPAPLIKS